MKFFIFIILFFIFIFFESGATPFFPEQLAAMVCVCLCV